MATKIRIGQGFAYEGKIKSRDRDQKNEKRDNETFWSGLQLYMVQKIHSNYL